MMTIPWYKSKQFWFNVLAVVVAIAASFGFDEFEPDPATLLIAQLGIALINVVLRFAFPSKPQTRSAARPLATAKSATTGPPAERPRAASARPFLPTRVPARPDYTRANRLAAFWTVVATGTALIISAALTL